MLSIIVEINMKSSRLTSRLLRKEKNPNRPNNKEHHSLTF